MSLRPMGLVACVVLLYLFHSPLFDMAYSIGLYPRPSATEIEQWLAAKGGVISADCEEGVAGWAFVCDVAYPSRIGPSGQKTPNRQKLGINSIWQSPVASMQAFPPDQPIQTRDDFYKAHPPR